MMLAKVFYLLFCLSGPFSTFAVIDALPRDSTGVSRSLLDSQLVDRGWPNRDNSFSQAQKDSLETSFRGAIEMLDFLNLDNADPATYGNVFSHYFNPQDHSNVLNVIQAILNTWRDPNNPSPQDVTSVFNIHYGHPECSTTGFYAFWDGRSNPAGVMDVYPDDTLYICPVFWNFGDNSWWTCDDVRTYWRAPNRWMITKSSILVHELFHYDPITMAPNGGDKIVDHGPASYGPYKTTQYKLNPQSLGGHRANDNCANFEWFVSELYWSKKCNHQFVAPTSEYDDMLPHVGRPPPIQPIS